jgi:hypothetical protein
VTIPVPPHICYSPDPCSHQAFVDRCGYSDGMEGTPEGFTDKLYWRKARGE